MVFKKHGCGIMNTVITILLSRLDVFPTLRELEISETIYATAVDPKNSSHIFSLFALLVGLG